MEQFTTIIALIGIVIVTASLLSSTLDRSGVPLAAAFLVVGALLGPAGAGIVDIELHSPTLQVLATLALALVLFSDAVTLNLTEVRAQRRLSLWLLGPGTLAPAVLTAVAAWWLLDLAPAAAAILGAALASTDPVLLRRLLHSTALPRRVQLALRMETGMNDLVLLPVIVIAMLILEHGGAVRSGEIVRSAAGLFLLGPALGALVGWLGLVALLRVRTAGGVRRDYESLYALALAFMAFAAAEAVGGSGFLAAFAAGLVVSAQDVELCDCFLEYGEATSLMLLLLTFVALGTSLIWTGLSVMDLPTLAVAAVALTVRTMVLYPVLTAAGVTGRDRHLIALLGPRGLSSLLLVLLPVFHGVSGAERLFTITCLVVLLSILLHGAGIAMIVRRRSADDAAATAVTAPSPVIAEPVVTRSVVATSIAAQPIAAQPIAADAVPERITLEDIAAIRDRGEPLVIGDVRTARSYSGEPRRAVGAVRIDPEDAVRSARLQRLPREPTIALYCT